MGTALQIVQTIALVVATLVAARSLGDANRGAKVARDRRRLEDVLNAALAISDIAASITTNDTALEAARRRLWSAIELAGGAPPLTSTELLHRNPRDNPGGQFEAARIEIQALLDDLDERDESRSRWRRALGV